MQPPQDQQNFAGDAPVAMGLPVTAQATPVATFVQAPIDIQAGMAKLASDYFFPPGLLRSMQASAQAFPLRIWIVDNSGSMNAAGGSRIVSSGGRMAKVGATRWAELGDSVAVAGEIASALGARTDFNLLNPTPSGQFLTVGYDDGQMNIPPGTQCDLAQLKTVMQESPRGSTPLTEAIRKIIATVTPGAERLKAQGQQVAVVIATDGLPNDAASFLQALQQLQQLPVWVVVRLCTDQNDVVDYWSGLDKHLEAPLEVLDDLVGEAEEIAAVSPWLTYGPPLHYARELGCKNKLFDLLDETVLLPSQAKELAELILGCKPLPEPEVDAAGFLKQLKAEQERVPAVFHPLKMSAQPWFDPKTVGKVIKKGGSGSCAIS